MWSNYLLLLLLFAASAWTQPCLDGCSDSQSVSSSFSRSSFKSSSRNSSSSTTSSSSSDGPQDSYRYSSSFTSEHASENSFQSNSSSSYERSYERSYTYSSTDSREAETSQAAEIALDEDNEPVPPPSEAPSDDDAIPPPSGAPGDEDDAVSPPSEVAVIPIPVSSPKTEQRSVETSEKIPTAFYPCGYPKPIDPDQPDATTESQYYATPEGVPCPVTQSVQTPEPVVKTTAPAPTVKTTAPAPVAPERPQREAVTHETEPAAVTHETEPAAVTHEETKTESVPQPAVTPVPHPVSYASHPIRKADYKITAARVKHFLDAKDIKGLAAFVVESDDIYGLTKGFLFEDEERHVEIQQSDMRQSDKDVIALKALATAALTPSAKLKVIEIMVLTATSPDGYHFNEHRPLVEEFVEIFYDDVLLQQVIDSDAETYARRRLMCVGCTPVNSYVCAHCWPKAICKAYFWCKGYSAAKTPATRPSNGQNSPEASGHSDAHSNDAQSSKASKSKKRQRRTRRRRRNRKQTRRAQQSQSSPP